MTDEIQCIRCGEEFDSYTQRTMHIIRKRCPEVETEEDVDSADTIHGMEEIVQSVKEGDTDEKLEAMEDLLDEEDSG